jgi:uncharacterized cupin superfamily protein
VKTKKPFINIDELSPQPRAQNFAATGGAAERFDALTAPIAPLIGAEKLGYNLTVVPPGKSAFPFHSHRINEEMFFILAGVGELRMGEQRYPVRKGDIIACPPGGKEQAHQIWNTGSDELRYLAVSTKFSPEVCEYPDSQKFGLLAEYPASGSEPAKQFRFVGRESAQVDYWDGE